LFTDYYHIQHIDTAMNVEQ